MFDFFLGESNFRSCSIVACFLPHLVHVGRCVHAEARCPGLRQWKQSPRFVNVSRRCSTLISSSTLHTAVSCMHPHALHVVVCCVFGGEWIRRLAYEFEGGGFGAAVTAATDAFFVPEFKYPSGCFARRIFIQL